MKHIWGKRTSDGKLDLLGIGQKVAANGYKYPPNARENVRNERLMVSWGTPGDDKEVEDEEQALGTRLMLTVNRGRYNVLGIPEWLSGSISVDCSHRNPRPKNENVEL